MNTTIQKSLKWTIITGLFAIPFIPFIVTQSMLFPFITGKGFTFRILIEIIFALWAILAIAVPEYRPKWNLITKSLLAFLAIVLLADIVSIYPYKSLWSNYERMEGFVTIIHLVAFYFVASTMLRTATIWKWFLNTWLFGSVIMSIYGFLQLAGKITINQGGVRLDTTFGNASYLAIYTVFMIFMALILWYREKNIWWRVAYGAVIVLNGIVLYYTATRGSILGLIGGLILTSLLVLWKEKNNKMGRKIAGWLLIIIAVVVVLFAVARNTSFIQKSPVLARFTSFSLSDPENQGREFVWPMAIKGFEQRPILGWGQESFNYVFNQNYNPAMYNQEQWFDRAHDIFLDWMINAGALGLLAYISIFVALIYMLWKKSDKFSIEEKSLLTGLMAAYVFNNIFVFDNLISYLLFFSVLAWVSAISTEPVSARAPKMLSRETLNYLVIPVIAILCIACVYFVNVPAIEASSTLIQAINVSSSTTLSTNLADFQKTFAYHSFGSPEALEQLISVGGEVISSNSVDDTTKQNFYQLTDTQIQAQIQKTPKDARYLLLGGSFYNQVGQYAAAEPLLVSAEKYTPGKPAVYFELASSYLGTGDTTTAFSLFTKGYDLATSSPDSQVVYAVGAMYAGQNAIVQQMFALIGTSTLVSDDRILQAYVNLKQYPVAETILATRLEQAPNNYNTELQLASVYATAGDNAKAIELIQDVETKNPSLKSQLDPYITQLQAQ